MSLFIEGRAAVVEFEAVDDEALDLAKFIANVYDGGPMRPRVSGVDTGGFPIVIEIKPIDVMRFGRKMPVLYAHDRNDPIGHTTRVDLLNDRIKAEGVLSVPGTSRTRVVGAARSGFQWAVSIGFEATQLDHIPPGKGVTVNTRRLEGPLYVARRGILKEISLLTIGADRSASATVS